VPAAQHGHEGEAGWREGMSRCLERMGREWSVGGVNWQGQESAGREIEV
jgi:hypothetical protein